MSLKSLSKTRWKIEADRITIYPAGLNAILSSVLTIIFIGIFIGFRYVEPNNTFGSTTFAVVLLIILALFFASAFTYVEFDKNTSRMKKLFMGFIPVKNIPFDQLYSVNVVTQNGRVGGYNYRIFSKADKYGKGVAISSGYSKDTDPNAIAFNEEVVTLIHRYLDQADPIPFQEEIVTEFNYFNIQDGIYTLKQNRIGNILLALALLALAVHELTDNAWSIEKGPVFRWMFTGGCFFLAVIFLAVAFTKITFDTKNRIVQKKSPIGLGNVLAPFNTFERFHTIRKTYNGVYSGTEVHMYFNIPEKKAKKAMMLKGFNNPRKIERLVIEVKSILK